MLQTLEQDWRSRVAHCPFAASLTFDAQGLRLGLGTLLFAFEEEGADTITLDQHAGHDRLVALLAVAGNGALAKDGMLHVGAALADWRRGDKALAAIRLAFARLPRLADRDAAYRLFLAEKVLDGGLAPDALVRELGYARAIDPLLKFSGQARVPKGSGRPSGQFAGDQSGGGPSGGGSSGPARTATGESEASASVVPVFYDSNQEYTPKPNLFMAPDVIDPSHGHVIIIPRGGAPLPFLSSPAAPAPSKTEEEKEDDKNGPECPPMEPDRPNGENPAGDREEHRVAALVNASSPTPKWTPENPDVKSMAYYLPLSTTRRVANDDCKRTDDPTPAIPDLRKGDMVEVKAKGVSMMITLDGTNAQIKYDDQIERQIRAIRLEGKGRRIFTCVGSEDNVASLTKRYTIDKEYEEAHYVVCRDLRP